METDPFFIIGKPLKVCLQTTLIAGCCLATMGSATQADGTAAEQVIHAPLFQDSLDWVGAQPAEAESQALLADINVFRSIGIGPGFVALEQFVTEYPHSGWTPDLQVHLAEHDRACGRYAEALSFWQAVWDETKDSKDAKTQAIAVRAMAGWTRLLASLGQKDQLEMLFGELASHHLPLGPYATKIQETKEGLAFMNSAPGKSYRCGSFALGHMAQALHSSQKVIERLFTIDSPDGGFTMLELLALARTNGLEVEAVRRPSGAPLEVPCVVHWKLNHYAAITEEKNGRYRVEDPTFERSVWMDPSTIDAEASGDFILPKSQVPSSWKELEPIECSKIYGKGNPAILNNPNDCGCGGPDGGGSGGSGGTGGGGGGGGGLGGHTSGQGGGGGGSHGVGRAGAAADAAAGSGGSGNDVSPGDVQPANVQPNSGGSTPCHSCGMPQWSVSEPYENLWLKDTPLLYQLSDLTWERLSISYKQRGESQASTICGFGTDWSCGWIEMLQESPEADTASEFLASGGVVDLPVNSDGDGVPEYKTGQTLDASDPSESGFPVVVTPGGATNIYGYAVGTLDGITNYFLTQRIDRYGRVMEQFNYQAVASVLAKLVSVIDLDGQTDTLAYGNVTFPNLITAVTNRYGNVAYFNYNSSGILTNMVDAQGMSTYFQYDGDGGVTNMLTPYGTNSFQFFNSVDVDYTNAPSLGVLITEASGDHQLYVHNDNAPDSTVDADVSSYHWDRKQYAAISATGKADVFAMTADDYELVPVESFLYDSDDEDYTLGDTLYLESGPVDPSIGARTGKVQYQYDGQDGQMIGQLKRITSIISTPAGGFTYNVDMAYNDFGNLTNYIYNNSTGSAGIASYTNFYDPSGRVLQYQTGPMGELTLGCGYGSAVSALVTSITNALGDVTRYTYDSGMRLTSIQFSGGLVRTNIYYTSGAEAGFLAQKIDIGCRTNSFGWQNGNLATETNELGLVTDYTYDNLNRLTSIAYPDGTTISNVYSKLDIVATKDRLNQWTYYGYNQVRQLMAMTNADGQVTTFDYCGCGSPDEIIHWDGASPLITLLAYSMSGLLTNVAYPDGYTLSYAYDSFNRPSTITDSAGNEESLSWSQHGLQGEVQSATLNNGTTLFSKNFDQYGRVIQSLDRNGVTVTNGYDFLDRVTARQSYGWDGETLNQSGLESFIYGPLGLTNYVDQLGHLTAYVRDLEGNITAQTNGNNEVLQFAYNPANEMLAMTDGKGQITKWTFDSFGRTTSKIDNAGVTNFIYRYDANNRLTNRWTPAKGSTVYRYDPLGNVTNVDYSGGTAYTPSISFAYDFLNRLTNMLDGIGTTAFAWTPGDQMAGETGPWQNDAVSYSYNGARQRSVMSISRPNGNPWNQTYGYDALMRLSTVMSPAGGSFSSPMGTFTYLYPGPGGTAAMDRPLNVEMPGPGNPIVYNYYDGLARTFQTSLPAVEANLIHQYSYDEGSEVTQQVFTASSQYSSYINYSYDNIGQLKTAKGFDDNGTTRLHEQFGYGYDEVWNLTERTNNALVQSYAVNDVNELSSASLGGTLTVAGTATVPSGKAPYYNDPGVTGVTVNGNSADVYEDGSFAADGFTPTSGNNTYTAIAQDNVGRLSTNSVTVNVSSGTHYTNDSNGNLTSDGTRNFAYDDENQLVAVWVSNSWSNSFAYDGLMRKRIEQQYTYLPSSSSYLLTNEVHYIYDGNVVLEERDKNNEPLTTYTRGIDLSGTLQGAGGIGGLLARSDNQKIVPAILSPEYPNPQNVVTSFYFNDAQGNVVALVSPGDTLLAQYKYDPFGNLISKSGPMADINKYRYSSKEWEQNAELYYYGYRFYDPNLQRWLNRDPNEEPGFLVLCNLGCSQASQTTDLLQSSIAGMNLYLYVKNNGLIFIDAEGLNFIKNIWQYLKKHAPPWSAPPPLPQGTGTVTLWFPPSPPGKHTFFCLGLEWSSNTNEPPPSPNDPTQSPWSRTAPPPVFQSH